MRMKRKPWVGDLYNKNKSLFSQLVEEIPGNWYKHFSKSNPINLEIGSGKGKFITEMAKKHPEQNFIALEISEMALAYLLRSQVISPLPNLYLVIGDAAILSEHFASSEINNIYLNFSDPWPKNRHEKRRLTYPSFLKQYHYIMKENGYLKMKTDSESLFAYSLQTIANDPDFLLDKVSLNLHSSEFVENNVMTEYETKFSEKGKRIFMLEAESVSHK